MFFGTAGLFIARTTMCFFLLLYVNIYLFYLWNETHIQNQLKGREFYE
jgi:hypothetical protein